MASALAYVRKLDQRKAAFLLPDDTAILARVFPVMMRVEAVAERPQPDLQGLDEQQIRKRSFSAMKELLRRLSQQVEIILVCDDLQWGDADSAQVLMDVLSGSGMPKLLFVGSFRSDEADTSPFMNTWREQFERIQDCPSTTTVEVSPLKAVNFPGSL